MYDMYTRSLLVYSVYCFHVYVYVYFLTYFHRYYTLLDGWCDKSKQKNQKVQ